MAKNTLILFIALVFTCVKAFGTEDTNYPIEAKTFYVDNTIQNLKMSKASSSAYTVKSIIENCFDESNIGKEAWLMTADGETQLSVTLSYPENDTRHKITSQEVSFYFYNGSNIFTDNNKELITDIEHVVGSYATDNTTNTATVTLTAPKYYFYTTNAYYQYYVVIKAHFENGGSASVAKSIGISRPGVLLLHGLGDNSSDCFGSFYEFLKDEKLYFGAQILAKNYSGTNTSSFYANTHENQVVRIALYELSEQLLSNGIASTKFDMIGHSMGGILERLYIQEIDNKHTNKLITLNTPHWGSMQGNIFSIIVPILEKSASIGGFYGNLINKIPILNSFLGGDKSKRAITDLAIGSPAIKNLNSQKSLNLCGIPTYAAGTDLSNDGRYVPTYIVPSLISYEATYLLDHLYYNYDGSPKERTHYNYLLIDGSSDGVVSVASQRGGLPEYYSSIYFDPSDSWNAFYLRHAFHCNSPKWDTVQRKLCALLLAEPNEHGFCMTGFVTQTKTRSSEASNSDEEVNNEDIASKYITDLAEPKPSSYIHLNMSSVSNEDYTHTANISTSDDMLTTAVFATLSTDKMIADYDKSIMNFNLEGYENEDEITFYAIGRTNYNALVIDSVKVNLKETNGIKKAFGNKIKVSAKDGNIKVIGASENYHIQVSDMLGRILLSSKSNNDNTYAIPTKNSLLFVTIRLNEKKQTYKIINN